MVTIPAKKPDPTAPAVKESAPTPKQAPKKRAPRKKKAPVEK